MDCRILKILGFYNKQNTGDEAYKIVFPKIFPKYKLEFLDNSEADILGGGDVLTNYYLSKIKNPIYAVSVSASENIQKFKHLIKHVIVRDYKSLNFLKEQNISASYTPDITFLLEPTKQENLKIYFHDRHLYHKKIAIILNAHLLQRMHNNKKDYIMIEKMLNDLSLVIDNTNSSFIFLPFCTSMPNDDRILNAYLASKLKFWQKTTIIYNPLSPLEILNIINSVDAVISTRLHSSIFATICQKPFLDITHNHKNEAFLETIGKDAILIEDFNYKSGLDMLNNLLENKPNLPDLNTMRNQIFRDVAENVCLLQ